MSVNQITTIPNPRATAANLGPDQDLAELFADGKTSRLEEAPRDSVRGKKTHQIFQAQPHAPIAHFHPNSAELGYDNHGFTSRGGNIPSEKY